MIDNVGLIHMNGRMYDPVIGRFLSPDPRSGSVGSPQSLNPYAYVENNPLRYVDPTGLQAACGGGDARDRGDGGLEEVCISAERKSGGPPPENRPPTQPDSAGARGRRAEYLNREAQNIQKRIADARENYDEAKTTGIQDLINRTQLILAQALADEANLQGNYNFTAEDFYDSIGSPSPPPPPPTFTPPALHINFPSDRQDKANERDKRR